MSRNIERSGARALYAKFAKKWRHEKREAGVYGQPGYKRPNFNEWYSLQNSQKKEKAPEHAYLEIGADDPWLQPPDDGVTMGKKTRGVVTINITGSEDD